MEQADIANQKLLHNCEILHYRLQDSSVDFFIEEEDKLILETASTADDAIDLLATSDIHISLILAEVLVCLFLFKCICIFLCPFYSPPPCSSRS